MKIQFEPREKVIIIGFLSMTLNVAIEDKNRKMKKYIQRLFSKFDGTGEVNLKKKEAMDINAIVNTALEDTEFDLPEGELPKISVEDYAVCKALSEKLSGEIDKRTPPTPNIEVGEIC